MLFLEDSYLKEFESVIQRSNQNQIILEKTAFYANSGGQPGDKGKLIYDNNELNIVDTIYDQDMNIVHICEEKNTFYKNLKIKGSVNWKIRYQHMKMHTALHLLCSIMPFDVTGGQISFEKSRLDFNDQEKKIIKEEVEEKINQLIKENLPITYQWITQTELDQNPDLIRTMSVKPPRTNDKIRLVKIGNVDIQPCGGTHLKSTNEIGKIEVKKIENKGRMNRRVYISIND